MGLEEEIESLNSQEKKVIQALGNLESEASVEEIQRTTGLSQSAVMRSALRLEEEGFIEILEETEKEITISGEGREYFKESLPERRVLEYLGRKESVDLSKLPEEADLPSGKVGITIGWLKRKGWAEIVEKDGTKTLKITDKGRNSLKDKGKDELLLEKFEDTDKISSRDISSDLREEIPNLKSRNILEVAKKKTRKLVLTEKGNKSFDLGLEIKEKVSRLTSNLLKSGEWKEVELRDYNVTAPGPEAYPGKEHPQRRVIEKLRSLLLRMGFEEIRGPIVESEFWNFDALFQAQDHPAREIHDTLSLSKPEKAKIINEDLLKKVKKAHEEGVAGSKGWGYKFDEDISHKTILRSQTTADTVRYLSDKPEPPVKVFCIDKVFRRERIDYQHLAEFPQAEGIVMAPELNFRHMLGYLKQILKEMGIPKIRFRPGYFPYTEPSAEADGYFPERDELIELLGAGMFRPELLEPLGIDHPVLAWGIGFSRIAMIRMGIEDMRDLHKNDIEWLKNQSLR